MEALELSIGNCIVTDIGLIRLAEALFFLQTNLLKLVLFL